MRLVTNIQPPYLSDIFLGQVKNFKKIKAAVAYCENYELFEYCKQNKIKLDYYGRLDNSINLDLKKLKKFLTNDISIQVIGGNKFHPKVIWCYNYGAYIGSANFTESAWKKNIECGLWLTHKELEDKELIISLEKFFKYIEQNSSPLSGISDSVIQKLNKHKQKPQSITSSLQIFKDLKVSVFKGCLNRKSPYKKDSNGKSSYKKTSHWNDINEMRCLLILKNLEKAETSTQISITKLCKEMTHIKNIGLKYGTIHMKVQNYIYLSTNGKKGLSNYSTNTERIYKKYKNTSIRELKRIIKNNLRS